MVRTIQLAAVAVMVVGTGCASSAAQPQGRRFDASLYGKAQQPQIDKVAEAVRACAPADTPVTVTWGVAGDGHIEDIAINEPQTPSAKEHACITAAAMRAQFTAPLNGKRVELTQNLSDAQPITQL